MWGKRCSSAGLSVRTGDLEARWYWFQGSGYYLMQRHCLCHSRDFNSQSGWPLLWPSTSLKDSQWSIWELICKYQCSPIDNFMWPFQDVLHLWISQYFFQSRAKRVEEHLMQYIKKYSIALDYRLYIYLIMDLRLIFYDLRDEERKYNRLTITQT